MKIKNILLILLSMVSFLSLQAQRLATLYKAIIRDTILFIGDGKASEAKQMILTK
jgi:hypothetical protein